MDTAIAAIDWTQRMEALYRADADRLWRALYAWSADADIANESVAEAYAQALRRGPEIREPGGWVWRSAFRIAAGALQVRRADDGEPASAETYTDRYQDPDLLAALQQLPEAQRAAVILFYYADLPISDIAHRLSSNPIAVRANLSRGRKRLHRLLGDHR